MSAELLEIALWVAAVAVLIAGLAWALYLPAAGRPAGERDEEPQEYQRELDERERPS